MANNEATMIPAAEYVSIEDIDEQDVVAQHGPYVMTDTRVIRTALPTYDQWFAATEWVKRVEKACPFWLGDLMLDGDQFGEMASQILDASEYSEKTLANAKAVAKALPPERRRPTDLVPYTSQAEIAHAFADSPDEQSAWLDKCESEELTREQLRVRIKAAKAESGGTAVQLWVTVSCSDLADQAHLVERMKTEGRSVKLHAKDAT